VGGPCKLLLLVEDDAWTRFALTGLVRRRGWEIVTSSTVEEGIALLDRDPDCVVLDLALPDGSGEAVLRTIREQGRRCRVAIYSAVTDEGRLGRIEALKPDAVFTKPADVDAILAFCCQ
jgi:two-component system OmpR family response regulator